MTSDFEQHAAFMTLAQKAYGKHAHVPTEATLVAAAKNLARLHTADSPSSARPAAGSFEDVLKRLADV